MSALCFICGRAGTWDPLAESELGARGGVCGWWMEVDVRSDSEVSLKLADFSTLSN